MAKIENGCLVIYEGDKYEMRGDTLVFIESKGEKDGETVRTDKEGETLH